MLLRLRSAPVTFQSGMDIIMSTVKWKYVLLHLDYIFTFSGRAEVHMKHTGMALRLLKSATVTLKLQKCFFFTNRTDNVGRIVRPGRLEATRHAADTIRKFETPSTVSGLRPIIGLCNVLRRFFPNFAKIASPLSRGLKKTLAKDIGPLEKHELQALDSLKENLESLAVRSMPKQNRQYILDTDACDKQVRCVLLQGQENRKTRRPTEYW